MTREAIPGSPRARQAIFTIGHSSHPLTDFVTLLRAHGIRRLVDVRTIPRSRHNPQFNRETLRVFLRHRKINYRHMPSLGGLRHARADSINTAWRNASFRGFADYMQTAEFDQALRKLIELAADQRTAIMCAEAVPWRCHRSLIADALVARGINVRHILTSNQAKSHELMAMARYRDGKVFYPAGPAPAGNIA